ncbi:MAG: type II toxin-antitoxin system YafQ family toxin [Candidatus Gastranaerophilales bacterium]|nr:type II toxin-antitoxin system YafQ family toxin [Candidatus Gastranaerophilales bacterium]
MQKRSYDMSKFKHIIEILQTGKELSPKYLDHSLTGKYKGCRECHIQPDWLLVYRIIEDELVLLLMATGTHSDLF